MSAYSVQSANQRKTWLLIFFFVGLVTAIFLIIGAYYNQPFLPVLGLTLASFQAIGGYFWGDKLALRIAGAKIVSDKNAPRIHFLVENLCKVADIPKPKIYISPDPSANAFACGRNPQKASICLNQGLLNLLNENELEGVIAHELAHIKNRDILVMTVTMVLASVISIVADIGIRLTFFGWGGKDNNSSPRSPILVFLYILIILLSPIIAMLIQMSVSRSREYLADATAVVFTRYPEGLINALQKLYQNPVPSRHYSTAMSHFYISPPKKSWSENVAGLFSTHPPIEKRIKALKEM
jgi:heat shock protein HtpX